MKRNEAAENKKIMIVGLIAFTFLAIGIAVAWFSTEYTGF